MAILNGINVAQAIREGLVVEGKNPENSPDAEKAEMDEDHQLFFPDSRKDKATSASAAPSSMLNPNATSFEPSTADSQPFAIAEASWPKTQSSNPSESGLMASVKGLPDVRSAPVEGTTLTRTSTPNQLDGQITS